MIAATAGSSQYSVASCHNKSKKQGETVKQCDPVEKSGDSEAPVESGGDDPDVGGQGRDQGHLGLHQDPPLHHVVHTKLQKSTQTVSQ